MYFQVLLDVHEEYSVYEDDPVVIKKEGRSRTPQGKESLERTAQNSSQQKEEDESMEEEVEVTTKKLVKKRRYFHQLFIKGDNIVSIQEDPPRFLM